MFQHFSAFLPFESQLPPIERKDAKLLLHCSYACKRIPIKRKLPPPTNDEGLLPSSTQENRDIYRFSAVFGVDTGVRLVVVVGVRCWEGCG